MEVEVRGFRPKIGANCFIAPQAVIIGDVEVGDNCSIWYNCVLRGDVMPIRIGRDTNIQDGTILHGQFNKCGVIVGDQVTVGHGVILHGCNVGNLVLVGMGSILMDLSVIGNNSIVGAGSLVTENSKFEDGMLIMGRPAKAVRRLTAEELAFLPKSAQNYLHYKTWYDESGRKK